MSNDGKDDYSADILFWPVASLEADWRQSASSEATAKLAELSVRRLKGIEMGLSGRGITSHEARRLASIYRVELKEIIDRALHS